ncbi:MAG: tetratricopeptide repeat protein, partial [Fimbriimonadaceae bacterium]|nr:tetratricopeptide repeat protein [Fimbriimonadaceae bacterium]
ELYAAVNDHGKAADQFEKALERDPDEPAIYTRLALSQAALGMPANAEKNLRRAMEKEPEPKPSTGFLADVLTQSGRTHEVPPLWKERLEANPQNPEVHVRYAASLFNAGQVEEGEKVFDSAIETLEDSAMVKRSYAPYLVQKQDFDRALDFYEDVLDVAPSDPGLMFEYAQALVAANRAFEAPRVLRDMLTLQLEPNLKAHVHAMLIEVDQPNRAEAVGEAAKKAEGGDPAGAVRDLKPLMNWLADYWKMWAVLANAYNAQEMWNEAEDAAARLIELFPGCEPAYVEYANALSGQEKEEQAYSALLVALQRIPGSALIGLNLALTAKRVGRTDEARELARQLRPALQGREDLAKLLDDLER